MKIEDAEVGMRVRVLHPAYPPKLKGEIIAIHEAALSVRIGDKTVWRLSPEEVTALETAPLMPTPEEILDKTLDCFAPKPSIADKFKELDLRLTAIANVKVTEAVRKHQIQVDELTERQVVEVFMQAIRCGDISRYVRVDNGGQTAVYIPFAREQELENRVGDLEAKLKETNALLDETIAVHNAEKDAAHAAPYVQALEKAADDLRAENAHKMATFKDLPTARERESLKPAQPAPDAFNTWWNSLKQVDNRAGKAWFCGLLDQEQARAVWDAARKGPQ